MAAACHAALLPSLSLGEAFHGSVAKLGYLAKIALLCPLKLGFKMDGIKMASDVVLQRFCRACRPAAARRGWLEPDAPPLLLQKKKVVLPLASPIFLMVASHYLVVVGMF